MSKFAVIFAVALGIAIISTTFAGLQLVASPAAQSIAFGPGVANNVWGAYSPTSNQAQPNSILAMIFQYFGDRSLAIAPSSWVLVGGLWIWRGRMKSRWEALGFDSEVFELFVRMRGGKTRVKLLNSLLIPKDRFQLAQELGLDWKAVDRHVVMLNKFGFIHEQTAYGRVRIYELTSVGKLLLQLLQNLDQEERGEAAVHMAEIPQPEL